MPLKTAVLAAILFAPGGIAQAADCDVAILNGRVMDPETNFDAVRNVCVKGAKITEITTDKISGSETIDAKGHVVAPGFVDGHVHIVDVPLGQKGILRDGVTTALDLEVGAYPVDLWYDNLGEIADKLWRGCLCRCGAHRRVQCRLQIRDRQHGHRLVYRRPRRGRLVDPRANR